VHGVVGMLQQVRAGRRSEAVAASHPSTLFLAVSVGMRAQLNESAAASCRSGGPVSALGVRRPLRCGFLDVV
jgi:hypothetical protein